jgi:hypothetical protein
MIQIWAKETSAVTNPSHRAFRSAWPPFSSPFHQLFSQCEFSFPLPYNLCFPCFLSLSLFLFTNFQSQMLASLPLALGLLLSIGSGALAAPRPDVTAGQSIKMYKRSPKRNATEMGQWAKSHREMLMSKYSGGSSSRKRSSGTNL